MNENKVNSLRLQLPDILKKIDVIAKRCIRTSEHELSELHTELCIQKKELDLIFVTCFDNTHTDVNSVKTIFLTNLDIISFQIDIILNSICHIDIFELRFRLLAILDSMNYTVLPMNKQTRPRGRNPAGKKWDDVTGKWIKENQTVLF